MKSLIIDTQYFGTINSIKNSFQNTDIKIEQYESFQKMSFRNRCMVAGSNGVVNLSVPLEKGRGQKELMKDVKISYRDHWQVQHWRTIESCYSRAPFFEFYRDGVFGLLQQKQTFLLDLNMSILEWMVKIFKFKGSVSLTDSYHKQYPEEVKDLRGQFLPKHYALEPFELKYVQVFEDRIGFQPNLSILDLLFCDGTSSLIGR